MNQYGVPVAEVEAATLNTEGQGARPDMDGVHAYGFPWGHAGRSPDTEDAETEYQFLRLFFNLRRDNGGFGKFQGGAGVGDGRRPAPRAPHVLVVDRQELVDHERGRPVRGLSLERQPRHLGRGYGPLGEDGATGSRTCRATPSSS